MKISCLLLLASAGVALAVVPASAFVASNGLVVEPRADAFHIPYRGKSGAVSFWCAAGEYALHSLHASPVAMIYRTSEPPRRSGEGIGFSLAPGQSASATGLIRLGAKSGGMSVASALNLCDTDRFLSR